MLFEAASDVTANILFTATELQMLFRLIQHFMRTLSRRTHFYALIAGSKNWKKKYFGGNSRTILWDVFRKTVGGAVSSQSKHLIYFKNKTNKKPSTVLLV